jgi:alanine racemase
LTPVIHEATTLRAFDKNLQARRTKLKFQLEVDTGMGRIGFPISEIDSWLPLLTQLKALTLDGLFSHFSDAETGNEKYTGAQLKLFHQALNRLNSAKIFPAASHMAKSAALITVPASHLTMVRPGLILYGMYPASRMKKQIALKPVLSWRSRIIQLKTVPTGSCIGYGRTFATKRNSQVATLPVGYADGYRRLFSNRAAVLVRGQRAPVVGRVSMDLTTIDVTDIRNVQQGDEVVLLGRQENAEISADEMADWANTISYEIFTSIGARVPRIHIDY